MRRTLSYQQIESITSHHFRRDKFGNVDFMAHSSGDHNGPVCERCHMGFCEHCEADLMLAPCAPDDEKPTV